MADSLLCPFHSIQFSPLVFLPLWLELGTLRYLVSISLPAVLQATDFADLADLVDFALPCLLRPDFVFALPPLSLSLFSCKKNRKFLIAKWNPDLRKPDLRKNLD